AADGMSVELPDHVGLGRALELRLAGIPAEHGGIELLIGAGVAREYLGPAERARLVDQVGAGELLRLPHAEHGARGIAEEGHAAEVHHVHRLDHDVAAGVLDLARGVIGVVHAHVGGPHSGLALLHGPHQAADVLAALLEHAIAARLFSGSGLRRIP